MKYKHKGSAGHLNQLWKQTHLSDFINLTQFGPLWVERLPDWFAMLQFLANTVCINKEVLACSTWGNALFNLLKSVQLGRFPSQGCIARCRRQKKRKANVNPPSCDTAYIIVLWLAHKSQVTDKSMSPGICQWHKDGSESWPRVSHFSTWIWVQMGCWVEPCARGADQLHDLYTLTAPSCYDCQSLS